MSGPYVPKKALQKLNYRLSKSRLPKDVQIFFVLGYPRADIGKGTLVANMLRMLPNSDAIKFDGLLNTNNDSRYTPPEGRDDFAIYEKYNPSKKFGEEHYFLGGHLLLDFITEYGEYENLMFKPYMSLYFASRIQEMWHSIGKPDNLIIEIGGIITDPEVDPYVTPALQEFKSTYNKQCRFILLSETGYNNKYIKTKMVQDAVDQFIQRQIEPDIVLAREPAELHDATFDLRVEFERTIREKLSQVHGLDFRRVISVPFYKQDELDLYSSFLDSSLKPFFEPAHIDKLLIGSSNPYKIKDWKAMIGDTVQTIAPDEVKISLDIPEAMTSVRENSLTKAKAWCRASGLPTLADDRGFYIQALDGQPGVGVRRWGGDLPESTTDEEFYEYLQEKVKDLKDTACYFETVVTIALPNGDHYQVSHRTSGMIDQDLLKKDYELGDFPLSRVFVHDGLTKTRSQMTEEELTRSKSAAAADIKELIVTINTHR